MVKAVHDGTMICRVHAVKIQPQPAQNTAKIWWPAGTARL